MSRFAQKSDASSLLRLQAQRKAHERSLTVFGLGYGSLSPDAHRPILFSNLLFSGKLDQHVAEIDRACIERMDLLTRQMADREDVTEALKAANQMEWVRRMNNIRSRAEEIVLNELVYC